MHAPVKALGSNAEPESSHMFKPALEMYRTLHVAA